MRIADKMAFTQVNNQIAKNRFDMSELQHQAATQKRINKPSDDPLAAARVLGSRTDERVQNQFVKSLNVAKGFLEYTDQSLGELTESLMRAKELAINQANDASANDETRKVAAEEVEQLLFQAIQIGNRKLGDRYIFAGYKTTTSPFNKDGQYRGDDGDIKIQINKDTFLPMNIPGNKLFLGEGLDKDGVSRAELETPRSSEELRSFKRKEIERLQKEEEMHHPDQVYSQDRGLASVPTETNGDSESTWSTQGVNLFQTLKSLEVALRTGDKAGVQDNLDTLDEAIAQVVLGRSQVGARVMALNSTMESLQKSIVDSKVNASQLEDADVFQTVSDINKTESTLKATLETSGKLIQPSLLDFLR